MTLKGTFKPFCIRGHARTPDNLYNNRTCKVCTTMLNRKWQGDNREQANQLSREWRELHPELFKESQVKSRYHIPKSVFQAKKTQQENACAVCRKPFIEKVLPHIDHDHKCCPSGGSCGECFRGLLCRECNLGLGYFKDNKKSLLAAVKYLKSYDKSEGMIGTAIYNEVA